MCKENQISEAAKANFKEGLKLIKELEHILFSDNFKNSFDLKKCYDLETKYRKSTYTSNTGHVQFIQRLVEDLSISGCSLPQIKVWISEARKYVEKGV